MPTEGHGVDLSFGRHAQGHAQSGFPWKCVQCEEEQTGPLEEGCVHCGAGRPQEAAPRPTPVQTRSGVKAGPPPMPAVTEVEQAPAPEAPPSPAMPATLTQTPHGWRVDIDANGRVVSGEAPTLPEAMALAQEALAEDVAVLFDSRGDPIPSEMQAVIADALERWLGQTDTQAHPLRPTVETWVLAIRGD